MSTDCATLPRRPTDAVALAVRTAAAYMGLDEPVADVLGRCAASLADGGEVSVPDVARLYGRTTRWVWQMVERFAIRTTSRGGGLGSTLDIDAFVAAVGLPGALRVRRGRPPRSAVAAGLVPRAPIEAVVAAASSIDLPRPGRDGGGTPLGTTPTPPGAGADGAIAQSARSID